MGRTPILNRAREAAKIAFLRAQRRMPLRKRRYLVDYILPEEIAGETKAIRNVRVLRPAEKIEIASRKTDAFVRVGKYFRSGRFVRPRLFVCNLPDAFVHVGTGLVCTRDMKVVPDFEYRLVHNHPFGKAKPANARRLAGTCATINFWNSANLSHWVFDCLPRLHSLAKAEPTAKVKLVMPDALGAIQREMLECILPSNFSVEYHPKDDWVCVENLLWPSMVSRRCNFFLPSEYYEAIRRPVLSRLGLSKVRPKNRRIFITRRMANRRRMLNEDAVIKVLAKYAFECIELQGLSLREQVTPFHEAEVVIGAHGAGLSWLIFSGKIDVVVIHATQTPQNHYHTLAMGLGQRHHFMLHDGNEDDDFTVDTEKLERLLQEHLGLKQPKPKPRPLA